MQPPASIRPIYLPLSFEGLEKDLLEHSPVVFRHYILFLRSELQAITTFYTLNMNSYELKKGTLKAELEEETYGLLASCPYVSENNIFVGGYNSNFTKDEPILWKQVERDPKFRRIKLFCLRIDEDLKEQTLSISLEVLKENESPDLDRTLTHFWHENSLYILSTKKSLWRFNLGKCLP